MGCGSSQNSVDVDPALSPRPQPHHGVNGGTRLEQTVTHGVPRDATQHQSPQHKSQQNNTHHRDSPRPIVQKPPPVAFDISLNDNSKTHSLIAKHPPKRLQLEPLNLPRLTADMLIEKQQLAEAKRAKMLDEKVKTSKKSSRLRRDIQTSQQMEEANLAEKLHEPDGSPDEIQAMQKNAEELRQSRQLEIREKQRSREERAMRVREKSKRIKAEADAMVDEIEKDEDYNLAEDDVWDNDGTESGYASPQKGVRPTTDNRDINSASTIDSFDNAFNRMRFKGTGVEIKTVEKENLDPSSNETDAFFDT